MALTTILRRSASTSVPFAARLIGRQKFHHHSSASACAAALCVSAGSQQSHCSRRLSPASSTSFPSAFRWYSSKSDESLLRAIEDEIRCTKESDEHDRVEETPNGFPFELEDNPGQQTITLNREYQGETITIEVHMPTLVTGDDGEQNEDDNEETERGNESSLPLVVRVSKTNGPCLEFGCTSFPDEISIDSLSVKDLDNAEDQIAYEGPNFEDLDENLQKAFLKYLEIRGVKPSTTNFLHEYMINKDSREYLNWLTNLKKFVEA